MKTFWSKVNKTSDCWVWTGAKTSHGYGSLKRGPRSACAHRVSWEDAYGPIPTGMAVIHTCDNPACVRPEHLAIGSQRANQRDKVAKNRQAKGSGHGRAKLTEEDVADIRARAMAPIAALADDYGVSRRTIQFILERRTWRHVA